VQHVPRRVSRVAFVGQSTYFEACAAPSPRDGVFAFFEFRAGADAGALLARLIRFAPDLVIVFRPEIVPEGLFRGLDAVTLGFLTEPLPRHGTSHPDLERRLEDARAVDPTNYDRVVAFDPLIASTVGEFLPVWRSLPLPVADRFYCPVRLLDAPPQAVFVGRSTRHREALLVPAKHEFDVLHVAHGVGADALEQLLRSTNVGINLHSEPYLSFENRVALHLAAGHLVVSEPLDPTHGLEPGLDFLEITAPGHLWRILDLLHGDPNAFHRVRVRGRFKAEGFRASSVYARLVHDLMLDLAAFGGLRARAVSRS
jgi:hypothetical protein